MLTFTNYKKHARELEYTHVQYLEALVAQTEQLVKDNPGDGEYLEDLFDIKEELAYAQVRGYLS